MIDILRLSDRLAPYYAIEVFFSNNSKNPFDITDIDLIKKSEFTFPLLNIGDVPIDQIAIEMGVLEGATISTDDPSIKSEDLLNIKGKTITINLLYQLEPNGYVFIDLKKPILELLQTADFPNPGNTYLSGNNILFIPRRTGEILPVQAPGNVDKDRTLFAIKYEPKILSNVYVSEYINDLEIDSWIINYLEPTEIP